MFTFPDSMKLGVDFIDKDHQHLFDLLNRGVYLLNNDFTSDKYDQIKDLFDELLEYANSHFEREEAYMKKLRDPEYIMQRVQHDHFRAEIWQLEFIDIDTDEEQKEALENILNFLAKWLYQHIAGSDALIGKLEPMEDWMVEDHPCAFTEKYLTGNALVDGEHKTLFEISGKIYDILKEGATPDDADAIINLIDKLKVYTKDHFADEEEYMESINYAGIDAQKQAHKTFIAELEDIDYKVIHENPQKYVTSLLEFLLSWLINHIFYMDKKIFE